MTTPYEDLTETQIREACRTVELDPYTVGRGSGGHWEVVLAGGQCSHDQAKKLSDALGERDIVLRSNVAFLDPKSAYRPRSGFALVGTERKLVSDELVLTIKEPRRTGATTSDDNLVT